jgi:hypothetical protein
MKKQKRSRVRRLAPLLLAICCSFAIFDAGAAVISGHVQSSVDQVPIAGARIEIAERHRLMTTAVDGKFEFTGVPSATGGNESDDGKCDGGYDLLHSLYLTFRAGLLIAIYASQVTSC